MTLIQFDELLKTVFPNVFHYEATKTEMPYIVWHEYGKRYQNADNKPYAGVWRVQVDYYTKKEHDEAADSIETLLTDKEIPFTRKVFYDRDRDFRYIRHIFSCEVLING